ncbi:MAG: ATP-binding protein [Candidatus Electrothrix sp. AR4]|nr:ATP-binding protein [Candidatus Electrothrix sp. AR4]
MCCLNLFIISVLENIPLIDTCLLAVCRVHTELFEKQIFEIRLAVVEWLNNVIEHGYKNQGGHGIWIALELESACLTVTITDQGEKLPEYVQQNIAEFRDCSDPPFGLLDESGRGLFVAVNSVDKLCYCREKGQNVVKMTKYYGIPSE